MSTSQVVITYIGGGSKDWAHKYFADLLSNQVLSGELRLYDIDVPAAQRNKKFFDNLKKNNTTSVKSRWSCSVIDNIDTALTGADFVLISILPYSLQNMQVDVHYPEKYGIWQSVGDTVGPGGYSRALRTIPAFEFFADRIRANCPKAWVINYTNPMAMCVNTLYRVFPEIKAFGCCHEVFGLQSLLAAILSMYKDLSDDVRQNFLDGDYERVSAQFKSKGKDFGLKTYWDKIDRHEIKTNVQGINHFTWVNKATCGDVDLFPIYEGYIKLFRAHNAKRLASSAPAVMKRAWNAESVKFELFEKHGIMAAAGDRHLAEFVPNDYLRTKHVLINGFELTPVWGRIAYNKFLRSKTAVAGSPLYRAKLKKSGEEGVRQLSALCGHGDLITNVNLPNTGQAENLEQDTAVETNAVFTKDGIVAVPAGVLKESVADIVNVHATNQRDFVDAFLRRDKAALMDVFCNDPAVRRVGKKTGERMFIEMIEKNRECLDAFLLTDTL